MFVLWTLFFLVAGALRHRGAWGTLVSAVLLSEVVNANRIDFRNVYCETTYFVVGTMLAACIAASVNKLWHRPSLTLHR